MAAEIIYDGCGKRSQWIAVDVVSTCGRYILMVNGLALAMEGDPCRCFLPEEILDPIPEDEMKSTSIGGVAISEMPIDVVRMFRPSRWTKKMLDYVAEKINAAVGS